MSQTDENNNDETKMPPLVATSTSESSESEMSEDEAMATLTRGDVMRVMRGVAATN